jgi:hypothetical protein
MNYLQLAQELARKAGVSGQPSSTIGQKGEMLRLVNWINHAWVDIQTHNARWPFLWRTAELNLIQGQREYALPADCRELDQVEMQLPNNSWRVLSKFSFEGYNQLYRRKSLEGEPLVVTVTPSTALQVYPLPDSPYHCSLDYYKIPQVLSAVTDAPQGLPEHYHHMIVWLALKYYGEYEQDMEVVNIGNTEYQRMMTACVNDLMPDIDVDRNFTQADQYIGYW